MTFRNMFYMGALVLIYGLASGSCSTEPRIKAEDVSKPLNKVLVKSLDDILAGKGLLLSSDKSSSAEVFFFVVELSIVHEDALEKQFDILVARNGAEIAVMIRFADGRPFTFMRSGMLLVYDKDTASYRLFRRGHPRFGLEISAEHGGAVLRIGLRRENADREFKLDFEALLSRQTGPTVAVYDLATSSLTLQSSRSTRTIEFIPNTTFPINRVEVQNKNGTRITVRGLRVSEPAPLDLFTITPEIVLRSGLVAREMGDDEVEELSIFPPKRLLEDARGIENAARLSALFNPQKRK